MIRYLPLTLLLFGIASASQIFFMDLEDDIMMSDNIFLAEVLSVYHQRGEWFEEAVFDLLFLEDIECRDLLPDTLRAVYVLELPRPFYTPSGEEYWESPIVNGSGLEFAFGKGDTVLVMASMLVSDEHPLNINRLEPADSLAAVERLMEAP